ncbi:MAG: hypothetical protein IJB41_10450 [Clostridia bacterium]|nr:hypothetical protein [Clostridia bacterium]
MEDESIQVPDFLDQLKPDYWRTHPPVVMRGDAKVAFKAGATAEKMKCTCWNKRCPFYGNCRKCLVFHMALKQFPTCQREMVTELCLKDLIEVDMHIKRDENGNVIESLLTEKE